VIYINEDITSFLQNVEGELYDTNKVVERFQRRIIFLKIKDNYRLEYIEKQKRIQRLKKPITVVISVLNEILGKENYIDEEEIVVDYNELEEEYKKTSEIIDQIEYEKLINYFHDTVKLGLVKANNQWSKKITKKDPM
jgi:hypothetical protein